MKPVLKATLCVALACVALLGALAQPGRAAAAGTPCWKTLLNDWYDGRIDGSYARHCYSDALHHLPADVSTYSSAHDDILRALQSAIAKQGKGGHKVGPDTVLKPPPSDGKGGGTGTRKGTETGTNTSSTIHKPDQGQGPLTGKLNPSSPSSLPVPLLVLGGLALLLVAAGGAGLVAKRIQARRQNP
jgi:hypothetical protein